MRVRKRWVASLVSQKRFYFDIYLDEIAHITLLISCHIATTIFPPRYSTIDSFHFLTTDSSQRPLALEYRSKCAGIHLSCQPWHTWQGIRLSTNWLVGWLGKCVWHWTALFHVHIPLSKAPKNGTLLIACMWFCVFINYGLVKCPENVLLA